MSRYQTDLDYFIKYLYEGNPYPFLLGSVLKLIPFLTLAIFKSSTGITQAFKFLFTQNKISNG
jgi:hypothetical protein